ncbi:TM2 domain-containing protein [Tamlana fucoidanivorans]|uniref:TM2 domain-containing protein n=1 Tax=Allotamlana fucoidanivorans TaxID=2583814 RepID=A0A5C4SJY8_9FLAO|nr:TM2 domain-containing protein [Tamlana fucoidanivorans]TNJ44145.1 TM2 domain-containing protein [Tamlana fucoidanivorans]
MSDHKNTNDNLKEKANEFANEAKETASEFANNAKETFASTDNKKVLAGILGILLGGFGIHKFILGYNKEGFILLIATILTCGVASIIGFIEGIIYLTKSDADFYNTYQVGKKPWF